MSVRWAAVLPMIVLACSKGSPPSPTDAANQDVEMAPTEDLDATLSAQRMEHLEQARRALDAGTWTGGELYATSVRTSVMSVPAWPNDPDAGVAAETNNGQRLGYLRHGSHVPVFPERIKNDACSEGWFELLEGGFVCGKYASLDPKDPAVKFAANPPRLDAPMPYRYGFATGNDTPVYRRVLSLNDRKKYEPWLIPAPPPSLSPSASMFMPTMEEDNPYDDTKSKDAGVKDAGVIKLGSLRGRGVLARKMMTGFYVALDRDFTAAKAKWWRTAEGFAIPYERIALQGWTPGFHGSWVTRAPSEDGGEVADGNGMAALVKLEGAARYIQNEKGAITYAGPLPKWTAVELVGEPMVSGGVPFSRTTSGFYVRMIDLKLAAIQKPNDLTSNEKWIDVDLDHEVLVAFEGDHPVYATLVSSGRRTPWDPDHDHPTPTGTFRIYEKHISATMDGDVAADGPYSIEDVPWVMFFQGSYALHGAFWHNLFGTPKSHGCVNLSPIDARELFFWTEPRLPKGWHGVFQTGDRPGTRVVIHETPPSKH